MTYREVVLSHEARKVVEQESSLHQRLEEAFMGLEWRVSHSPQDGEHVSGNYWVIRLDPTRSLPGIALLYSFDDTQVHIHRVQLKHIRLGAKDATNAG